MKLGMRMAGILLVLLLVPAMHAQQQAKTSNEDAMTHLRVDVLLTEYNGDKKISSLPYTIYAESSPQQHRAQSGRLRMGVRVPVDTGNGYNYMDVGTNIDCNAWTFGDNSYDLSMSVNRSSIYSANQAESESEQIHAAGGRIIIRNFSTDFDLKLRDGETTDGTSATDPLNGHVLKISVTLHVIK